MRWLPLFLLAACAEDDPAAFDTAEPEAEELDPGALYVARCQGCHGSDGLGSNFGPSLGDRTVDLQVDDVSMVILDGFGDMPPIRVTDEEADVIAVWVLEELFE